MKKIKIEFQITLLTIIIAIAVSVSGYLVYQSLSKIVSSFQKGTRPDFKLLLIKDIDADLTKVENTIRLYSLSGDPAFLHPYDKLNQTIHRKLDNLEDYAIPGSAETRKLDSIRLLTNRKLQLWEQIRNLHQNQEKSAIKFEELYAKIDTSIIQSDTITFPKKEKKGFFKRVFGRQEEEHHSPVIIDNSKEKEALKKELSQFQERMDSRKKQFQQTEQQLYEHNIVVTKLLRQLISSIEENEQESLLAKTQKADRMAAQTYRRMATFSAAVIILLIIVLILFFRNLKQNRLYQQILSQSKARAEELTRAKELFIATVSHEMRTPINAIFGLSEQLTKRLLANDLRKDLSIIHQSAIHLITLVNDTLDFSKMDADKLTLEQENFSPAEVIDLIRDMHQGTADAKGIALVVNNNFPPQITALGDPVRLKQILINLLTNAIKFTEKGSVRLEAYYKKEENSDNFTLLLNIEDSGIGMEKEDREKIFEEFVQLDNDKAQKHRGTGLGLAIVKKLINLHHGKIKVDSSPGKGTLFSLEIPYARGTTEVAVTSSSTSIQIPEWFKMLNLLIVDDEEFNLYLLKNILSKWNVAFEEAANGQQAVEQALQKKFDLILMDLRMPVLDGYHAGQEILASKPEIRIIALTATSQPSEIKKIYAIGFKGFLQKPFSEQALIDLIYSIFPAPPTNNRQQEKQPGSSTGGPMSTAPHINLEELRRQMNHDEEFFREMVSLFIKSSKKGQEQIEENLKAQNWIKIAETAHKLAAPVKHMMANELYKHLKELEKEADTGTRPDEIIRKSEICLREISEACSWLEKKLS